MNSKAHFVPFKTVMSIFFRFEYSLAYLLFILNSIRSISVEKGRLWRRTIWEWTERVSDFKALCKFVRFTQKSLATWKQYKKQAKNDQNVFRDKNFIQRNAKFAVRSEKRTNFMRVRNPRNVIFHASAVVYLISRPENCAALRLKFWKLFELIQNRLLNNTSKTYQHLTIVFTGPWNCPNVAKLHWSQQVRFSFSSRNSHRSWQSKGRALESSFRRF